MYSAVMSGYKTKLIVAAIDFGTTYSGYAHSLKDEYQKDPLKELNDLLSCFGLTDNTDASHSAGPRCDSDGEVEEEEELSIESRLHRYFIATPLEDNINESESPSTEQTHINSDDPQSDINNVKILYDSGCKCTKNCFSNFPFSQIESNILNLREMAKGEKEMLIMGTLKRISTDKRCTDGRKRSRYDYFFDGVKVCHETFLVVFDTKDRQLRNIKRHMEEHGAQPRVHGHTGRRAPNAFPPEVIKDAVQYLLSYANEEGLPQPAALRGRGDEAPVYLPSSDTKQSVHSEYIKRCMEAEKRHVGLTTFKDVWKSCVPHIKIASPKEDVCKTCEDCKQDIQLATGENDKISATQKYHLHVLQARKERELYVEYVNRSTAMFVNREQRDQAAGDGFSTDDVHYTFDFSQYIKLPHHAQEKGPTFFIQPRKVQIFGFRVDGFKQYNYLIDEDQTIGQDGQLAHGPDSVISMLDHAFDRFSTGETECAIHADNCFGQNKNRYVLGYLSWRTMTGRHRNIKYMMQLPGHTRCLIDAGFGTIKKLYRRSNCDTLQHVTDVVQKSAHSNIPVTYGENGWVWREWKMFLGDRFKKVPNISKYHHYRFTSREPGVVYMKVAADDAEEVRTVICKTHHLQMASHDLPPVITPRGLSRERREYLYRHVRPLVRRPFQDILCPSPIYANQDWTDGSGLLTLKAPTVVLFDQKGNFNSFGYEAETNYAKLSEDEEHLGWKYFRRFKMKLHERVNLRRDMMIYDDQKNRMPAIDVFSAAIAYLKDHLMKRLRDRVEDLRNTDVHWVLTVPAIWHDGAKQFMKEAADKAGIPDDQLTLALEPEAAAIYCKELVVSKAKEQGKGAQLQTFSPGAQFMVLDLGGGTVDITVHEVQRDGTLKELHSPSGGPWGGTVVDKGIDEFLDELFGRGVMTDFRDECKSDDLDLQRTIELKKRTCKDTENDKVNLKLPNALYEFFEEKTEESFAKTLPRSKFATSVKKKRDRLHIENDILLKMFKMPKDNLVNHVENLLRKPELKNVKTLMMVGGFSESDVMKNAVKSAFPNKRVIVPEQAGLAVVKGAVMYGHNTDSISSRKLPYTYGISTAVPFDERRHPNSKKVYRDGVYKCEDVFKVFVKAGTTVVPHKTFKEYSFCAPFIGTSRATVEVYRSQSENPMYVSDPGCYRIGEISVTLLGRPREDKQLLDVVMLFGDTELHVTAKEHGTNNKASAKFNFLR